MVWRTLGGSGSFKLMLNIFIEYQGRPVHQSLHPEVEKPVTFHWL